MADRAGWQAAIDQLDEAQYWAVAAIVTGLASGVLTTEELERFLEPIAERGRIPTDAAAGFNGRRLRLVDGTDNETG